jgi:hypothetical protein
MIPEDHLETRLRGVEASLESALGHLTAHGVILGIVLESLREQGRADVLAKLEEKQRELAAAYGNDHASVTAMRAILLLLTHGPTQEAGTAPKEFPWD